jgi:Flp pilus assembly protein TadG
VTTVETALSAMVFVMVLAGIVEAGQLLYSYAWVSDLAREATRYAMVRGSASGRAITASGVSSYVQSKAASLNTGALTTTTTWSPNNCNSPGCTVQVEVQYTFTGYYPFLPVSSVTVKSTSQMVISQ